jgi:hypothetical protein
LFVEFQCLQGGRTRVGYKIGLGHRGIAAEQSLIAEPRRGGTETETGAQPTF